jgi:transcriptional regulator with XRE-family HTH domain
MAEILDTKQTPATRRAEQIQVVKTFGSRMKEAREICGYSQKKAAKLLGYGNSSKLAKIEGATDTNSVPLWLIPKAADVYKVSVDFLFGVSDDWERDPVVSQERQVGKWLFEHWERAKVAEVNAIRVLHNRQVAIIKFVSNMLTRSKENLEYVEHVRQSNEEFDDLRGGAKLLRLLAETAEEAMGLSYELNKIRALSDVAKKENVNLDIFDGEQGGE